jgi:hypothetical protein
MDCHDGVDIYKLINAEEKIILHEIHILVEVIINIRLTKR